MYKGDIFPHCSVCSGYRHGWIWPAQLLPFRKPYSGRAPHWVQREILLSLSLRSPSPPKATSLLCKHSGPFHFSLTVRETETRAITAKLHTPWRSESLCMSRACFNKGRVSVPHSVLAPEWNVLCILASEPAFSKGCGSLCSPLDKSRCKGRKKEELGSL